MLGSWLKKLPISRHRKATDEALEHLEGSLAGFSRATTLVPNEDSTSTSDSEILDDALGLTCLYESLDPQIDLIFVHGLGGGSQRSWSFEHRPQCFWPRWLQFDPQFKFERIFTFGYPSSKVQVSVTIAGIQEFAQTLLNALSDSSLLKNADTPIVLIGHSMGGIVIKQAFVTAHQDPKRAQLAQRLRSIYFLGTPHAGSATTEYFKKLVKLVPGLYSSEPLGDLGINSHLLEDLVEPFARSATTTEIRTFYENKKSKLPMPLGQQYIVDKRSARTWLSTEVPDFLDTDHRGLNKFETPLNPDYAKVRNALANTVDTLLEQKPASSESAENVSLEDVGNYLGVHEAPEDDLLDSFDRCHPGTCRWFTSSIKYDSWRGTSEDIDPLCSDWKPRVMLVEADPGSGKSVLSSHVVMDLLNLNLYCSFFFLKTQGAKSGLANLYLSLAFQIAQWSPVVRRDILALMNSKVQIAGVEERQLWRKLFVGCIFKSKITRPQYWVLDGIDGCPQVALFLRELQQASVNYPLHVFLTTRPSPAIKQAVLQFPGAKEYVSAISWADNEKDIKMFTLSRLEKWKERYPAIHAKWLQAIMSHANGCFLWVRLILDNIANAMDVEEVEVMLQRLPPGMNELYDSILGQLDQDLDDHRKQKLKTALQWVACANPGLTEDELETAIQITYDTSQIFIQQICELSRNLLYVDKSKTVRLIHETFKRYLMDDDTLDEAHEPGEPISQFKFSSKAANYQISKTLIACLNDQIKPGRTMVRSMTEKSKPSSLMRYAARHFSSHVRRASPDSPDLLVDLDQFFQKHGIDWIAYISSSQTLKPLVRTSANLRDWLRERAKLTPPINGLAHVTERVHQWTTDLVRLCAKFGKHFKSSRTAIYTLVPPFIPNECLLAGKPRADQARVVGVESPAWTDRLCTLSYENSPAMAIANGYTTFAVGLQNGQVHQYDNETLQVIRMYTLGPKTRVKGLQFSTDGKFLFCYGYITCKLWNTQTGAELWCQPLTRKYLAAAFYGNSEQVICVTDVHEIVRHNALTGKVIDRREIIDPSEPSSRINRPQLVCAAICNCSELVASAQRGRQVKLSGLTNPSALELYSEEPDDDDPTFQPATMPVVAMTFSQNEQIPLLAVAYRDGALAVFDHQYHRLQSKITTLDVNLLASTADGHTLATANEAGDIRLYNFDTLDLLHTIFTPKEPSIRALTFIGNEQSLADIRGTLCTVWQPPVVDRSLARDNESATDMMGTQTEMQNDMRNVKNTENEITAILCIPRDDHVICGFTDGTIALFASKDGCKQKTITEAPGKQWITALCWDDQAKALAVQTGNFHVIVYHVSADWDVTSCCAQIEFESPVSQILLSKVGSKLLLFAAEEGRVSVHEYKNSTDGQCEQVAEAAIQTRGIWSLASGLLSRRLDGELLVLMEQNCLSTFSCSDLSLTSKHVFKDLKVPGMPNRSEGQAQDSVRSGAVVTPTKQKILIESEMGSVSALPSPSTRLPDVRHFCVQLHLVNNPLSTSLLQLTQSGADKQRLLDAQYLPISHHVKHVIGVRSDGQALYFLDHDLWLSSYVFQARTTGAGSSAAMYLRHLIIPDDWISRPNKNKPLLITVGPGNCIIFVRRHAIAVIRHFTQIKDPVTCSKACLS